MEDGLINGTGHHPLAQSAAANEAAPDLLVSATREEKLILCAQQMLPREEQSLSAFW